MKKTNKSELLYNIDNVAKSLSLYTELIEAYEWEEDKASEVFSTALDLIFDAFEYSQYDNKLIKTKDDIYSIVENNIKPNEQQFKALKALIEDSIERFLAAQKSKN